MVPTTEIEEDVLEGLEETEEAPSYDFAINSDRVRGIVEELEEIKQAIYLILSTERYEHPIYPDDYGIELNDLYGEDVEWVIPELELRITEALLMDDRILEVSDFEFDTTKKRTILVSFTVETTKGTLDMEKEVEF